MIKRISFDAAGGVDLGDAPAAARPLRVVVCTALHEVIADQKHQRTEIAWFADIDHLRRFDDRTGATDAVVVAEEHVVRGGDWLEARWRGGGPKFKHMAIARRAAGLSPEEFSQLWASRAGRVGAATIPDAARGLAYVQNHRLSGDYDAINEVYFDEVAAMQARIDYFAATLGDSTEDDLVREHWFLAVREEVVHNQL